MGGEVDLMRSVIMKAYAGGKMLRSNPMVLGFQELLMGISIRRGRHPSTEPWLLSWAVSSHFDLHDSWSTFHVAQARTEGSVWVAVSGGGVSKNNLAVNRKPSGDSFP